MLRRLAIWFLSAVGSALMGIGVKYLYKTLREGDPIWRSVVLGCVIGLTTFFLILFFTDLWVRDWTVAILTVDRCYLDTEITAPQGANNRKDALAYEVQPDTPIRWKPHNCVMVVRAYQSNKEVWNDKQKSGSLFMPSLSSGETELKIFREGFGTPTDNIWIWLPQNDDSSRGVPP